MGEKVTRHLSFVLTDDETMARGRELAKSLEERDLTEVEAKTAAKASKETIEYLEKTIGTLTRAIRSGTENRPVSCEWVPDSARGMMKLVRDDDARIVESRAMTDDERQGRFFVPPAADE